MTDFEFVPAYIIDKICKRAAFFKRVLILVSFLFAASVPALVVSAVNHITPLIIVFAIVCGLSFLGVFYGWTFWMMFNAKKNLLIFINTNRLTGIAEIAESTAKPKSQVRRDLKSLLKSGYLPGWKYHKPTDELLSTLSRNLKCPSCGGPVLPEEKVCAYCKSTLRA